METSIHVALSNHEGANKVNKIINVQRKKKKTPIKEGLIVVTLDVA